METMNGILLESDENVSRETLRYIELSKHLNNINTDEDSLQSFNFGTIGLWF